MAEDEVAGSDPTETAMDDDWSQAREERELAQAMSEMSPSVRALLEQSFAATNDLSVLLADARRRSERTVDGLIVDAMTKLMHIRGREGSRKEDDELRFPALLALMDARRLLGSTAGDPRSTEEAASP
jgi:hypothetical protein